MNGFWENCFNSAIQSIDMANNIEVKTTPLENISNSAVNNIRNFCNEHERHSVERPEYDLNIEDARTNINELYLSRGILIQELQEDCDKLQDEQRKLLEELESSRKAFVTVTSELKKQLDSAKQGESEAQSKMFGLRLENKKIKVLLESEKKLVEMLKKELLGVKRTLKFAIKDFYNGPRLLDADEEFQSPSRTPAHNPQVRFADSLGLIDSPPKKTP